MIRDIRALTPAAEWLPEVHAARKERPGYLLRKLTVARRAEGEGSPHWYALYYLEYAARMAEREQWVSALAGLVKFRAAYPDGSGGLPVRPVDIFDIRLPEIVGLSRLTK